MPDSLQTTVGQFSSVGGRSQARAANARAVEPAADVRGAERGKLYVHVEVTGTGGGHAALYRQVLNAAQTAYYEMGDNVDAALRQAVRNAHFVLTKANDALPDANWRAGITCAVLLGDTLTLAQAGPTLALLSHPSTVEAFPERPGPVGYPLGGPERPDVHVLRTTVESGSILLLAGSDWLTQVPAEALAVAAAAESVALATDYLTQLAGAGELSALLVGFGPVAPPRVVPAAELAAAALAAVEPRPAPQPRVTGRVTTPTTAPVLPEPETPKPAGGFLRSLFGRNAVAPAPVVPAAPPPVESAPAVTARRSSLWLILALVGVPLIVAAIVLGMLWLRTRAAERQFAEVLAGAATIISDADALPDEAAARQRLGTASEFLDKAHTLRPDDAGLTRLQAQYDDILGRINHVTPLYGVTLLWDFRETGRQLERVVVGDNSVFVLDRGRQEVNRFVLGTAGASVTPADPPVILRKGQQVGDAAVSDLLELTWQDAVAAQRSKLLVMDVTGGLVGFETNWGANRLILTGRERWGLAQLAATYNGNLYVVDTKANQIWRYRPTAQGYETAPDPYFSANTKVDLAGVQSMTIDGNIWLLYADGRVLKFFAGEQKAFEIRNLPDPLRGPTALAAPVDGNQIYIADAGNGRIIELDKDGLFQRQLRPSQGDVLRGMRYLTLDATTGRFYVLTGDKLYRADLPKPAPLPTPTPTPTR